MSGNLVVVEAVGWHQNQVGGRNRLCGGGPLAVETCGTGPVTLIVGEYGCSLSFMEPSSFQVLPWGNSSHFRYYSGVVYNC